MTVRLGELISEARSVRCGDCEYPILSMTMHDGLVFQNGKFKKRIASTDTSNYKVVGYNQLVVSFPIDEGVLAVQRIVDYGIVSPAYAIWDIKESKVDSKYLELFLRAPSSLRYYKAKLKGTTLRRRTIPKTDFLGMQIPLPPFAEQKRIAAELDRICALKKNVEERLVLLSQLAKSLFVEMFGDGDFPERELISITKFIDYRGKTPTKSESGIPLITAKNVRTFGFSQEPREYIPEDLYESWMTRGFPRVGDVLFTTEAPLGNVCRIPNIYSRFAVGQRIVTMQPDETILNAVYLEKSLLSEKFQAKLIQHSSGSTVTGIRSKLLEKLTIPLPPLALQQKFAAFIEQLDKSQFEAQALIGKLDLLYRAKLQEYFG